VLRKIGSGAYGHVWKVRCRESRGVFAIKKVFLAFQDDTDAQRVYREIALLLKLRSELVVRLKEVLPSEGSSDIYLLFEHL
jgi:mitogen-activated protein kinase 15